MGHGLFSGTLTADSDFRDKDMRIRNDLFQGDNYIRNLAIVEKLKEIASETGHTPGQLAVSWVLHHPAISSAIVGATNKDQVKENAKRRIGSFRKTYWSKSSKRLQVFRLTNLIIWGKLVSGFEAERGKTRVLPMPFPYTFLHKHIKGEVIV